MTPSVAEVLAALAARKNVLLEGPPGTGKTRLVSSLIQEVKATAAAAGGGRPTLMPSDPKKPFGTAAGSGAPSVLPAPMRVEWVTFHQSYSYEEFILGKRPVSTGSTFQIEPQFGVLMSLAVELDLPGAPAGCLLVIDEVNRANASQVFGEFITLLDPDYRRTVGGSPNPSAVSLHLPGLRYIGGASEPIALLRTGGTHSLPADWTFPEHVYVLATMNSVDKAALPLDSALTRRFHRLPMGPDLSALVVGLGTTWPEVEAAAQAARTPGASSSALTAEETTVLLLERLNQVIATDLGEDFELGQGLVWDVVRAPATERWHSLAVVWDNVLLPQLVERFAGRTEALRRVLKAGQGGGTSFLIRDRGLLGVAPEPDSPLAIPKFAHSPPAESKATLQYLAV